MTNPNRVNELYFGCGAGYLDVIELRYRWFGAVWGYLDRRKITVAYWFGDSATELRERAESLGPMSTIQSEEVQDVYEALRAEQKE